MADKREQILAQLEVVLTALVSNSTFFYRNVTEVPEDKRPAIVLNDADDELDPLLDPYGKGRPPIQGHPVMMSPEIFVLLQEVEKIGTALNDWRARVCKAILTDATLASLCHEIRYAGFTSALANGRSMEGQARVHFSFIYLMRPDQL